jgi:6,7-dimethyl-8-ribityllumazine synthase
VGKNFRGSSASEHAIDGSDARLGIACARWNDAITSRLLRGATERAAELGVGADDLDVAWVPGAFELPLAAQAMAQTGRYDAVVALGCVIRGDTAHFEYVAGPASTGIMDAQLSTGVPIILGVLTTENRRQALVRSVVDGDVVGDNKGAEAVDTALEMVALLRAVNAG